jgi:hypothetical protein
MATETRRHGGDSGGWNVRVCWIGRLRGIDARGMVKEVN